MIMGLYGMFQMVVVVAGGVFMVVVRMGVLMDMPVSVMMAMLMHMEQITMAMFVGVGVRMAVVVNMLMFMAMPMIINPVHIRFYQTSRSALQPSHFISRSNDL